MTGAVAGGAVAAGAVVGATVSGAVLVVVASTVVVLSAVVVGMCLKGPRWGVPAVAFVLPMSVRLPNPPIPVLNMQNLLLLAAFVSLAVGPRREGRAGGVRFVIPLALFMMLITLSFLNTRLTFVPTRYFMQWKPYELMLAWKTILCIGLLYVLGCITPRSIVKQVRDLIDGVYSEKASREQEKQELQRAMVEDMSEKDVAKRIKQLEKQMMEHARNLEFEKAARVRDQLAVLREQAFGAAVHDNVVPIQAGAPRA